MKRKNEYKYRKTKELIKKLKPYWKEYQKLDNLHRNLVYELEKKMEKETGIKGIEFFFCDNECAGIGNAERTMELIHGHGELEDEIN